MRPLASLAAVVVSLSFIQPTRAETTGRTLGPHLFIPSTTVPLPFVVTSIRSDTGGGWASGFTIPTYDANGNQLNETALGSISFLGMGLDWQLRLWEPISLRVAVGGNARVGTTSQTLVASGLTSYIGTRLGASVRIVHTESFYLTGTVDFHGASVTTLTPLEFAQGIIDGAAPGSSPLVHNDFNWRLLFGGRAAYSVNSLLGFNAFLEGGPGLTVGTSKVVMSYGLSASLNLGAVTPVPIGLSLSAAQQREPDDGGDLVWKNNDFGLGIFVTGRNDFIFGLQTDVVHLTERVGGRAFNAVNFALVMRYDFF